MDFSFIIDFPGKVILDKSLQQHRKKTVLNPRIIMVGIIIGWYLINTEKLKSFVSDMYFQHTSSFRLNKFRLK